MGAIRESDYNAVYRIFWESMYVTDLVNQTKSDKGPAAIFRERALTYF